MAQRMRILIVSDSMALPRPDIAEPDTCPALLATLLKVNLIVEAQRLRTVPEALADFDSLILAHDADRGIVRLGICDGARRLFSRAASARIDRLRPTLVRYYLLRMVHYLRPYIQPILPPIVYTRPPEFEAALRELAARLCGRLLLVNIAPTTPALERHSPGLSRNIMAFNRIIQRVATDCEVPLADIYAVPGVAGRSLDGIHLTAAGNLLLAQLLARCIGIMGTG